MLIPSGQYNKTISRLYYVFYAIKPKTDNTFLRQHATSKKRAKKKKTKKHWQLKIHITQCAYKNMK